MKKITASVIFIMIGIIISGCSSALLRPAVKEKVKRYNINIDNVCEANKDKVLGMHSKYDNRYKCNEFDVWNIDEAMIEPFIQKEQNRIKELERKKAELVEYNKWSTELNIQEEAKVKEWQNSGLTLDEAKKWNNAGISADVSKNWKNANFTLEERKVWVDNNFNLSSAIQYKRNGENNPKAIREKLDKEQEERNMAAAKAAEAREAERKKELSSTDVYAGVQMYSYERENDFDTMLGGKGFSYSNLTGIIETNEDNKVIKITLTPAIGKIVNKNDINSIEKNFRNKYKLHNTQSKEKRLSVEERRREHSLSLQIWGGQPKWQADYNALQSIKNSSVTKTTTMTFINKSDKIVFVKTEERVGDKVNYDLEIEYLSKKYLDSIKAVAEREKKAKAKAEAKANSAIRGL